MRIEVVLPLPLGPRKPKISPRLTCMRKIAHHMLGAEVLVQVMHVDDEVGIHNVTSTGRPGLSFSASAGAGMASIRNTSLARDSLL